MWSRFIRILPIKIVYSESEHNVVRGTNSIEDKTWTSNVTERTMEESKPSFYFVRCKFHGTLSILYIFIMHLLGILSNAILLNLTQNAIQKIGFIADIFTMSVFPFGIVIFSNYNTSKVISNYHFQSGNFHL